VSGAHSLSLFKSLSLGRSGSFSSFLGISNPEFQTSSALYVRYVLVWPVKPWPFVIYPVSLSFSTVPIVDSNDGPPNSVLRLSSMCDIRHLAGKGYRGDRDLIPNFLVLSLLLCLTGLTTACGAPSQSASSASSSSTALSLSPGSATLASLEQLQFTARISGTPNTAVTWSASAGTISSGGSFTAPKVTSKTTVIITATSNFGITRATRGVNPSLQASAAVTVTPQPSLAIATSALPAADASTPYTASLAATGGEPPYQWSIASGTLPSGFFLQDLAGIITGTTTLPGSYSLTAKVTDAASNSATRSFTLAVSAVKVGIPPYCGAPNYCSSTSPASPGTIAPLFSGTLGQNQIGYDTSYNPAPLDCYTRATDAVTLGGKSVGNNTFSGGANDVMWSKNSDYVGTTTDGFVYILNLDVSGNCAKVINSGQLSGGSGIAVTGPFAFSRVTDNVFYNIDSYTKIYKNVITSNKTYNTTLIYDVSNCPQFSGLSGWSWSGILGVSDTDTRLSFSLSNTGGQDSGVLHVVYDTTLGCATLDTSTGAYYAFGATSQSGTLATATTCTNRTNCSCWGGPIHDSQFSGDGTRVVLANVNDSPAWTHGACSAIDSNVLSIWQAGTQYTQGCSYAAAGSVGLQCAGHASVGTSRILNEQSEGIDSTRELSNVLTYAQYNTGSGWASHGYWPQPDQGDDYPWVYTTYDLLSSGQDSGCEAPGHCPIAGGNAIAAVYPVSGYSSGRARTYFGHSYSCNDPSEDICSIPTGANWAKDTAYTITPTTSIITPTSGNPGNYSYEAWVGGTSGRLSPRWPQTASSTVTDGTVTWVNIGVAGAAAHDVNFGCQFGIMSVSQDGNWAALGSGMLLSLGLDSSAEPRCDTFIIHLR
jgi:Putative Ig domain